MAGRSKFTAARRELILTAVRAGHAYTAACALASIDHHTLLRWRQRGEAATRGVYHQFVLDLARARAEADGDALRAVTDALPDDPRLALDYLGRRDPENWARRTTTEIVAPAEPIRIEITWPSESAGAPDLRAVV